MRARKIDEEWGDEWLNEHHSFLPFEKREPLAFVAAAAALGKGKEEDEKRRRSKEGRLAVLICTCMQLREKKTTWSWGKAYYKQANTHTT